MNFFPFSSFFFFSFLFQFFEFSFLTFFLLNFFPIQLYLKKPEIISTESLRLSIRYSPIPRAGPDFFEWFDVFEVHISYFASWKKKSWIFSCLAKKKSGYINIPVSLFSNAPCSMLLRRNDLVGSGRRSNLAFIRCLHTKNSVCVRVFKFAHKKFSLRSCF